MTSERGSKLLVRLIVLCGACVALLLDPNVRGFVRTEAAEPTVLQGKAWALNASKISADGIGTQLFIKNESLIDWTGCHTKLWDTSTGPYSSGSSGLSPENDGDGVLRNGKMIMPKGEVGAFAASAFKDKDGKEFGNERYPRRVEITCNEGVFKSDIK